jgi:uncharacterized repeat protein (TIGR03803 family)
MTQNGGINSEGVIFEYNLTTNTYTKKFDFDLNNSRAYPQGNLMKSSNGKLYGMTHNGGANDCGVLFEYNHVSDTFTKKLDFNNTNGRNPLYTQLIEVLSTLGVSDNSISNLDIKIYPNPTNDILNIKSEFPIDNIEIYSVLGKKIFEIKNTSLIDLGLLSSGVYIVKVFSNNTFISKKILINN